MDPAGADASVSGTVTYRERIALSSDALVTESDGRMAFTNDTAYDVITRGNPRRVDMTLVMVEPPPEVTP